MAWLPLAAGVGGVAIGSPTDNMATWLGIGVAVGMGVGAASWRKRIDT